MSKQHTPLSVSSPVDSLETWAKNMFIVGSLRSTVRDALFFSFFFIEQNSFLSYLHTYSIVIFLFIQCFPTDFVNACSGASKETAPLLSLLNKFEEEQRKTEVSTARIDRKKNRLSIVSHFSIIFRSIYVQSKSFRRQTASSNSSCSAKRKRRRK